MTEYNSIAWEKLAELTGLSMYQLLNEIHSLGIKASTNTFISWRHNGGITPLDVVKICNNFHFPVSYFSKISGQKETEQRVYRLIPDEDWVDIELATSRIVDYVVKREKRLRRNAILRIGCSSGYYDALRKFPNGQLPKKLTFAMLLQYINNARMYPGDVVVDHNELFPFENGVAPFYDHTALTEHCKLYPRQDDVIVAEEMVDAKGAMMRYLESGRLEGEDRIIAMRMKDLNDLAGIILNLRNDLDEERKRRKKLEKELSDKEGIVT